MSATNPKCSRCGRRFSKESRQDRELWNVELRQGVAVAYPCPRCQTPEESAEATINEATLDYDTRTPGLVIARPKGGTA